LPASDGLASIDTGYTISKVRSAVNREIPYLVASSYEGTVLGVSFQGKIGWKNALSGFMNRDLWCADLTGDGADEILAANADGSVYCLDHRGELQWTFRPSDAPMNTVCVIRKNKVPYVVCGGYDTNIYYLDSQGKPVKTIESKSYSLEKPWGKGKRRIPPSNRHLANFLRPVQRADGTEVLAVHGVIYSNSARGRLYLFEPLQERPYRVIQAQGGVGEFRVADLDGDGNEEIVMARRP
jgi:WD40 repeat protein